MGLWLRIVSDQDFWYLAELRTRRAFTSSEAYKQRNTEGKKLSLVMFSEDVYTTEKITMNIVLYKDTSRQILNEKNYK